MDTPLPLLGACRVPRFNFMLDYEAIGGLLINSYEMNAPDFQLLKYRMHCF